MPAANRSAGLIAGMAIGALTVVTFLVVDNVWLNIVAQQQTKIDGFAQSGAASMRFVHQPGAHRTGCLFHGCFRRLRRGVEPCRWARRQQTPTFFCHDRSRPHNVLNGRRRHCLTNWLTTPASGGATHLTRAGPRHLPAGRWGDSATASARRLPGGRGGARLWTAPKGTVAGIEETVVRASPSWNSYCPRGCVIALTRSARSPSRCAAAQPSTPRC